MRWLSVGVCGAAAWRLVDTPLQTAAAIVAISSVAAALVTMMPSNDSRRRVATAVQHLSLALGGFFLFVSIAMR